MTFRRTVLTLLVFGAALQAAPRLRLSRTTVGPVVVNTGANGPAQTLDAANLGDGSLNLTFSSSATWLAATAGAARACSLSQSCVPVNLALNTAALARGRYTGILTIRDGNAIDAPQTVSVTIQIGSGVPDNVTLLVAPGGEPAAARFNTGGRLTTTQQNPVGGVRLSLNLDPAGSFATNFSYTLSASAPEGTPASDYNGAFSVVSSTSAIDTPKAVPVVVRVTNNPIATVRWPFVEPATEVERVSFRTMQGSRRQEKWIQVANRGNGNLTIASANVTATGGTWLASVVEGSVVRLFADPANLAPGSYSGSVAIATNAANATLTVPVQLEVSAAAPPRLLATQEIYSLDRGGVRNNATFLPNEPLAPGGLAAVFGDFLTAGPDAAAAALPLGTALGGATVFVNDVAAPIYFVAASSIIDQPGQITFQIPFNTAPGDAVVRVDRDGQRGNSLAVRINQRVPRLLVAGNGYAIATHADNAFPWPTTPGLNTRRARAGDTLVFYALGFGGTTPSVASGVGAPSSPLAELNPKPTVTFGGTGPLVSGIDVAPDFAGLTPGFVGLYQINVVVPQGVNRGDRIGVIIGYQNNFSNRVDIAIQ